MRTTLIKKVAAREWRVLQWIWDAVIIVSTVIALAYVASSLHALPVT